MTADLYCACVDGMCYACCHRGPSDSMIECLSFSSSICFNPCTWCQVPLIVAGFSCGAWRAGTCKRVCIAGWSVIGLALQCLWLLTVPTESSGLFPGHAHKACGVRRFSVERGCRAVRGSALSSCLSPAAVWTTSRLPGVMPPSWPNALYCHSGQLACFEV
jgi:hypothetical protein